MPMYEQVTHLSHHPQEPVPSIPSQGNFKPSVDSNITSLFTVCKPYEPAYENQSLSHSLNPQTLPHVEVMALTLNDTPLNKKGFSSLDGGRGWVNTKFLILSVGAAGRCIRRTTSNHPCAASMR